MYLHGCAGEAVRNRTQLRERKFVMQPVRSLRRLDSVRWFFLFALLAVTCCPLSLSAADKVITDADKGGTVHLKTGETLELRLRANPTTGFMWYLEKESTPLLKLVHQTQTEATEPGVGRPVFQVFKFEAKRYGEGVLRMHYVRSWEPPTPDDERFDLHVVVE
jgi:inhibitor of cysteine peptidase